MPNCFFSFARCWPLKITVVGVVFGGIFAAREANPAYLALIGAGIVLDLLLRGCVICKEDMQRRASQQPAPIMQAVPQQAAILPAPPLVIPAQESSTTITVEDSVASPPQASLPGAVNQEGSQLNARHATYRASQVNSASASHTPPPPSP